jgi:23S rRNA pseudouridine1911/1915/1917 synthase
LDGWLDANVFIVPSLLSNCRLDVALSALLKCSRSHAKKLIEQSAITCNEIVIHSPKSKVQENDRIALIKTLRSESEITPVNIKLDIVFEDEFLLAINKPAGLVVHPAIGHYGDTLVNAIMANYPKLSDVGDHPGIVHRLDKDTSGLILVAKTNTVHVALAEQFRPTINNNGSIDKKAKRTYIALVYGRPCSTSGTIQTYIARNKIDRKKMRTINVQTKSLSNGNSSDRLAITNYELKKTWIFGQANASISLMHFHLLTGRTHQIRVHSLFKGFPIIGDQVYNKKIANSDSFPTEVKCFPRQALHAFSIALEHPMSHKMLYIEAPIPDDLITLMEHLQQ